METIRPVTTTTRRLTFFLGTLAILGAIGTIAALGRGDRSLLDSRALAGSAAMLAASSLGIVFLGLWELNARLFVGPNLVGYRDLLGRNHTWSGDDVGALIDVAVDYSKTTAPRRALFVLGVDGRRLMALNLLAWPPTASLRIAQAARKHIDRRRDPIRAKAFRREFPHAMTWASTHPNLMGTLLALSLITLPFILVIGASMLGR